MSDSDLGYQTKFESSADSSRDTNENVRKNHGKINGCNIRESIEAYVKFDDFIQRYQRYLDQKAPNQAAQRPAQSSEQSIPVAVQSIPMEASRGPNINGNQPDNSPSLIQNDWQIINHSDT